MLLYIHGGGFSLGDATDDVYGPDFLLSQDNIVVTIQYRLGIFGFLNLNHDVYTGNMGLKDQQLALAWIYVNIENFGGNRDEILLFGESAGGSSVAFQMLNVNSRKYFQRAYASSGTAFSSFSLRRRNHMQLLQNCSHLNDVTKIIEYLKETDAMKILFDCYPAENGTRRVWAPTIEMPTAVDPFLTKTPNDIYDSNDAPVMDAMFSFSEEVSLHWFWNHLPIFA